MRLSRMDFDLLDAAIMELHQPRETVALNAALPGFLSKLIPADCYFLLEYELSPRLDGAALFHNHDPGQRITVEMLRYTERRFFTHPFARYLVRTGDVSPLKISDFYNRHQFRGTEIYDRFYKALEADGLISTALVGPKLRRVSCLNLSRRRDFTERDRLILTLLRPHIQLARGNAEWESAANGFGVTSAAAEPFTQAEERVARWLAAGKTDGEIAMILMENVRTVERRVSRILKKLGVKNRTSAAVILTKG